MKCDYCNKQVGTQEIIKRSWFCAPYKMVVIAFHYGKNGKPCPGSGR